MRLNKPYSNKQYADLAVYCNKNGLIIEDKGDYLETVNPPEKPVKQKEEEVRAVRKQYLYDTDIFMLPDFPITEAEEAQYIEYRVYLRNYPETENWYEKNPLTFEEWVDKRTSIV